MSVSGTLLQSAIAAVIAGVPTVIGGMFAFRQATRVQRSHDQKGLTDDLQEEVAALRTSVAEGRKEADQLRFRLRAAMDYLDLCMSTMRRSGVEPPPVPAIVRHPWEGGS